MSYTRYLENPSFNRRETFKTELGAVAIPTYEAFETMFPAEDREGVTDAWGECNFAAGGGRSFIRYMTSRYGAPRTFADFVRKSQLMGYEAHRAMYEGRLARMFAPAEGVLLWMSIPSHPSLVWNLMSYDNGDGGKNGASYDVNSPAAGPFLLTVECANVSEKWQRLKLSVNGKESLFNVEPTGSDQVARQLQEMVYLKAGDNRVEVYTTEGDKRALRIGAVAVK